MQTDARLYDLVDKVRRYSQEQPLEDAVNGQSGSVWKKT